MSRPLLRLAFFTVSLALAGACGTSTSGEGSPSIGAVAHERVQSGATLLDVRTPEEFASGHIEGAINIPVDEVDRRMTEIPADRGVVVYCRSGGRSARAAATLSAAGYEVTDLGPMSAW
ncbi:MAG: rhodanese-like domain-containing protein [Sandaracinaceae bacterium]